MRPPKALGPPSTQVSWRPRRDHPSAEELAHASLVVPGGLRGGTARWASVLPRAGVAVGGTPPRSQGLSLLRPCGSHVRAARTPGLVPSTPLRAGQLSVWGSLDLATLCWPAGRAGTAIRRPSGHGQV